MSVKKLNINELAKLISPSSDAFIELKERGVLRTKNVVGELGEFYAVDFFNNNSKLPNLSFAPPGVQNIEALSRNGEIYSIKTVSSRSGTTGSFWDPDSIRRNEKKFDYLFCKIWCFLVLFFCVIFLFIFSLFIVPLSFFYWGHTFIYGVPSLCC